MRSSERKAILSVIIAVAISEAVAKPPSAIKQSNYIGPDDYSFVARIAFHGGGTCAGAIISPRHIITAGSCLHDKTGGIVYTGIQRGPNESVVVSDINQVFVANFTMPIDGQDVENDIGIVSLHTDLVFNLRQRHIDLPTAQPADNFIAWVAGWEPASGDGDVPLTFKKTQLHLRDGQHCLNSGTDDIRAQKLCGYQQDANLCPGESGSPVVSNGILYGIASVDPCNGGSGRRYTNVFHHINWIKGIIGV